MGYDAIKFELIEWLTNLEDGETVDYLKIIRDANVSQNELVAGFNS
ncbi:MAG: hypothetical protein M0R39_07680 [Prolixibacteraceae bacterium]|nr:hypothetical protein [Prolixibacteraceae bacterium]